MDEKQVYMIPCIPMKDDGHFDFYAFKGYVTKRFWKYFIFFLLLSLGPFLLLLKNTSTYVTESKISVTRDIINPKEIVETVESRSFQKYFFENEEMKNELISRYKASSAMEKLAILKNFQKIVHVKSLSGTRYVNLSTVLGTKGLGPKVLNKMVFDLNKFYKKLYIELAKTNFEFWDTNIKQLEKKNGVVSNGDYIGRYLDAKLLYEALSSETEELFIFIDKPYERKQFSFVKKVFAYFFVFLACLIAVLSVAFVFYSRSSESNA